MEMARVLASLDPAQLPPAVQGVFEEALAEYRETQRVNLDRPEARQNLDRVLTAGIVDASAPASSKSSRNLP
ncbi:MAG: hypothetical protein WEA09_01195 [Gemmatimonadota bacterium]